MRRPKAFPSRCKMGCSAGLLLAAALLPSVGRSNGPSVEAALRLTPIQKVAYDQPTAAEVQRCTISAEKIEGRTGWVVRDPAGRTLRRFIDTNGDNVVDQWCYFRGGIEVYRDIDSDFNGKADQHRWLNTAGRRWALDHGENGHIDAWKAISAEEVSAELVAALADRDERRFRLLLLTPDELKELGLGEATAKLLAEKIEAAPARFRRFASRAGLTARSNWVHFSASQPGVVPAGQQGSTKDLEVYENVAAMVETDGKQSLLYVGTMIAVGDAWKLIDAPGADTDAGGEVTGGGFFFQLPMRGSVTTPNGPSVANSEEMQKLLAALEGLEKTIAAADDAQKPGLNERRAAILEQLMNLAKDHDQREAWGHQLADTVSAAAQGGAYPDGVKRLEEISAKLARDQADSPLASYFRYRALLAGYTISMQASGADPVTVQARWLKGLEGFIAEYPHTADTPEAMLQLAIAQEFAGEEGKAKEWYGKIVDQFSTTPMARKATGARRRLESVGQPMTLRGRDLSGRNVDLARYHGRVVLIQYWSTWCEPCKADMELLQDLVGRYGKQGFSIVGVNLDGERHAAVEFLTKNRLPWVNVYEPGGLESRLALEMGVLTLPTMLLVDQQGNVVNRTIHASQIESELKKRLKAP